MRVARNVLKPGKTLKIAEAVGEDWAVDEASAQEQVRRVCAKERSVGELHAHGNEARAIVVQVMHMGEPKEDAGDEDIHAIAEARTSEQRAHARAENPLFGQRSDNQISQRLQILDAAE